jgi:Zn-dependent peptidase ImmA (M78 family)
MAGVAVNPAVLRWARETAGLSVDEAVRKLQMKSARGVDAPARLLALEAGDKLPTRSMLVRMSKYYRRPLIAFYLQDPPSKGDRGHDFRRLPEGYTEADDALVDALLRDIRARQSLVRSVIEDEDEAVELAYVGSASLDQDSDLVAKHIRQYLAFDVGLFRQQGSPHEAFAYLRQQAEEKGIFVLLAGDLGSYHTSIGLDGFRGFTIADPIAPFVVINDQDARAAWSFTLLHELAHLWLGQTGISGAIVASTLERFCNDVASKILLADNELNELSNVARLDVEAAVESINDFADSRNVSRAMVAYGLYRRRTITLERWNELRTRFQHEWIEIRNERRRRTAGQIGGPDSNVVKRHRVGPALLRLVSRALSSGTLTSTKAGKILGVRPQRVYKLITASE